MKSRRNRPCWPSTMIWPAVGDSTPATIRISVLFPAPFSPTMASTSPRLSVKRNVVERANAGELFADVAHFEQRRDGVVRHRRNDGNR